MCVPERMGKAFKINREGVVVVKVVDYQIVAGRARKVIGVKQANPLHMAVTLQEHVDIAEPLQFFL